MKDDLAYIMYVHMHARVYAVTAAAHADLLDKCQPASPSHYL